MKNSGSLSILLVFALLVSRVNGSTLVECSTLDESIILIHFDDGYAVHHSRGQTRYENEQIISVPLDLVRASDTASYRLVRVDGSPLKIVRVARKSKPTEFALTSSEKNHVDEHWLYLFLEKPLEAGDQVRLETSLATNGTSFSFGFNLAQARSEAIHVNQVGYASRSTSKYGYVSHWAGDAASVDFQPFEGRAFWLQDVHTGAKVFSGKLRFSIGKVSTESMALPGAARTNDTGCNVWECDFSNFAPETTGQYLLVVDGIGCSFPFRIGSDALRPAFTAVMKGIYHQRSGIAIEAPFSDNPHPAAANPLKTPGFEHRMKYTAHRNCDYVHSEDAGEAPAILAEMKGELLTYGFYQDAGDWDGYFSHFRVPLLLMATYEAAPAHFSDGELSIPESGNGIPDILDEAAWLLRYFHRTRQALLHTLDSKGTPFGSGGAAGSRVAGDFFGADEKDGKSVPSWEDNARDYAVSGEDPFDSYYYAGLCAQMSWLLKGLGHDTPQIDDWKIQAYQENYDWSKIDWLREARETFAWAQSHTQNGDEEKGLFMYRFYGAASLYRLTGEAKYAALLREDLKRIKNVDGLMMLLVQPFLTLPRAEQELLGGPDLWSRVELRATTLTKENTSRRAFRFGGPLDYEVQVGQATSPMVEEAIGVYRLSHDTGVFAAMSTTVDYVLGGNPLNLCWPTRLGSRGPVGVFNMNYWGNGYLITKESPGMLSGCDITKMPPGIVPYGPTAHGRSWIPPTTFYSANWPDKWVYPAVEEWPAHELWFDQWCAPPSAEYTVHQTMVCSASVFGVLCADRPDASPFHAPVFIKR